jgi:putative ABC transport system permease protein
VADAPFLLQAPLPSGPGDGAIPLSALDLLVAAGLVLVAGAVSLALRLRLERSLAVASLRTVVQLLAVGYVLRAVFSLEAAPIVLAVLLLMCASAAHAAVRRPPRTYAGVGQRAFLVLLVVGMATTGVVTGLVVDVEPWWQPRYAIPLLGMVLGNSLTGISLCLDQVLERLSERWASVEMELAHGATSWEAARDPVRESVRRGMIPILNTMTVAGIVSLPGMMTGQVLAGQDPVQAVKYQIVVMFMIAGATSIGAILVALLTWRRLFNDRHQLRRELVAPRR